MFIFHLRRFRKANSNLCCLSSSHFETMHMQLATTGTTTAWGAVEPALLQSYRWWSLDVHSHFICLSSAAVSAVSSQRLVRANQSKVLLPPASVVHSSGLERMLLWSKAMTCMRWPVIVVSGARYDVDCAVPLVSDMVSSVGYLLQATVPARPTGISG